jgi:hypothetical protein
LTLPEAPPELFRRAIRPLTSLRRSYHHKACICNFVLARQTIYALHLESKYKHWADNADGIDLDLGNASACNLRLKFYK